MEPAAPPPPPPRTSHAKVPAAVSFSAADLVQARQRQARATTVLTLASGQRYHLELQADGSEKLTSSDVLGRGDGFVADTKPDDKVCRVMPGLFIGSQDASRNLPALVEAGVTHIVNAAAGAVDNAYPSLFKYLSLDMLDIPEFDMNPYFEETWQFVESAVGSGGGVLIHCNAGISRSATLLISYLIKYNKMTYDDAYQVVKVARPAILPNGGFQKTLRQLEKKILTPDS
eukprot:TRINITY_DN15326_c0_g1_i1.p1 TRINITY_DN15326_c0_g1~~TRINITY_DN15326_c0_g1_i1.p1  ORF type:complete len:230 (+),score=33.87 TRINITY_DN15326_c0_g1_i1:23-712(+)